MCVEPCPKCNGIARYEFTGDNITLECICGMIKYLQYTKDNKIIETRLNKKETTLPKRGSKLSKSLGVVAGQFPSSVTTNYVKEATRESINDVGSRMVVLYHRQLIDKVQCGKGYSGGSTWKLSRQGVKLLGI